MFDTAQRVLERVQRGGLVIVSLRCGQVELQLFQDFKHLLLGLGFGGLLTTASCTSTRTCTTASQRLQQGKQLIDLKKKEANHRLLLILMAD